MTTKAEIKPRKAKDLPASHQKPGEKHGIYSSWKPSVVNPVNILILDFQPSEL
jgi:hypothetical protein